MVKTNKKTIQLPLLIISAQTTLLSGLDWLQRLNEAIQIHNIKLDNTERIIMKLQNDFKALFYNNEVNKNLFLKIIPKDGAQKKQQKR